MEICEDLSMDLEMVKMRKRHCMDETVPYPNNKRTCNGLENIAYGNGQLSKCGVVYWQMQMAGKTDSRSPSSEMDTKQNRLNHDREGSGLPCQRCIAGESGHINHILGH